MRCQLLYRKIYVKFVSLKRRQQTEEKRPSFLLRFKGQSSGNDAEISMADPAMEHHCLKGFPDLGELRTIWKKI